MRSRPGAGRRAAPGLGRRGADAVEVVEPVGDVAGLPALHLVDQHPRAHGVHLAGVDLEEVVLGHGHGDQPVHQGPVEQRAAQVGRGVDVPEDQRGVVGAGDHQPALGLARGWPTPTHAPGRRRGAPGPGAAEVLRVEELAQQREIPGFLLPGHQPAHPRLAQREPLRCPRGDEPAHPRHPGDRPALPDDPLRHRRPEPRPQRRPAPQPLGELRLDDEQLDLALP